MTPERILLATDDALEAALRAFIAAIAAEAIASAPSGIAGPIRETKTLVWNNAQLVPSYTVQENCFLLAFWEGQDTTRLILSRNDRTGYSAGVNQSGIVAAEARSASEVIVWNGRVRLNKGDVLFLRGSGVDSTKDYYLLVEPAA